QLVVAHYNHQARGKASDEDQKFVERLNGSLGLPLEVGADRSRRKVAGTLSKGNKGRLPGFEKKARETRYAFLKEVKRKHGAEKILVAHTADDQVETVLMRVMEGAGISGLKGIPRSTEEGITRPLLDTWREDILRFLEKHDIPYRVDSSNLDTRFERNWVRHVYLPMLEKRYGKSVKKRILTLGERFREIDAYVEISADKWLKNYCQYSGKSSDKKRPARETVRFSRKAYADLPSLLRVRILQILCFRWIGTSPNERLLGSMDRLIVSGSPSARLSIGKRFTLRCQYGEAVLSPAGEWKTSGAEEARLGRAGRERKDRRVEEERAKAEKRKGVAESVFKMGGPGIYRWNQTAREGGDVEAGYPVSFFWEERGKTTPGTIRRRAGGEQQAAFDVDMLPLPLSVRPLRTGDRIRPFGLETDKKVKEILIDRKIPRDERWGRPVVCDAGGRIVWIPGVIRSSHAPVTPKTRRTIVLRTEFAKEG
ncbi:MAG: tRNA lysidine(34) synthetase TilS, partial [Deltaproteobacteria bacterium]|nr:tRNA lysidine(34) synthetase TilS [Deltaproteobacteria bacterium]